MTRDELYDWLEETCPTHKWEVMFDEEGHVARILIRVYEEEDDD